MTHLELIIRLREIDGEVYSSSREPMINKLVNDIRALSSIEQLRLTTYLKENRRNIRLQLDSHLDIVDDILNRLGRDDK